MKGPEKAVKSNSGNVSLIDFPLLKENFQSHNTLLFYRRQYLIDTAFK